MKKIGHVRNTKNIAKKYMDHYLKDGYICLDATIGNGNDILSISKQIGDSGKVYGFDIQQVAIDNTRKLLASENTLERAILIKDSHENIDNYIHHKLDFIIYNLGYLPKGNKSIKTKDGSTVTSINKALNLMSQGSLMLITTYLGHTGGMEENASVHNVLVNLNQRVFNVLKYDFINQKNYPPMLYAVEKL